MSTVTAPAATPAAAPHGAHAPCPTPTLYTVRDLARAEPALTVGGIRDDLFHRETNGLGDSGAVIRRGRRILLDRVRYLDWLRSRRMR